MIIEYTNDQVRNVNMITTLIYGTDKTRSHSHMVEVNFSNIISIFTQIFLSSAKLPCYPSLEYLCQNNISINECAMYGQYGILFP